DLGHGPDGTLVFEEALQHADCRVVRRACTLRRFAIPAAVAQLLADETAREALGRMPEIRAERERAAIDAWLHFAFEERLLAELFIPPEARLEAGNRRKDGGLGAIDAGRAQELQREEGR